ncbi:MAG TPA: hypothetical protein VF980_19175 [Thermoanaerobaculia bacterium]
MKVVRDRRDARWLPGRFNFALFRLLAYARLRAASPRRACGTILIVDRYQSAFETYTVAACVLIVFAAFGTSLFEASMSMPAACILGALFAILLAQLLAVILGAVVIPILRMVIRIPDALIVTINGAVHMALVTTAAALLAVSDSRLRYGGAAFLLLIAANALAAIVNLFLRDSFLAAERRFGVEA